MSKTTLRALGDLPNNFPEVGRFSPQQSITVAAHSVAKLKVFFFLIYKLLFGKQVQEDVAAIYLGGERSQ